jgi:hypothetical protein
MVLEAERRVDREGRSIIGTNVQADRLDVLELA